MSWKKTALQTILRQFNHKPGSTMKKLLLSLCAPALLVSAQAQTNVFPTTGKAGIGTTSPTKQLDIHGDGINLENTSFANPSGIIFKGGVPFISNFSYGDNGTVTTAGGNTFVGFNAGNLTMGSTAVSAAEGSYNTAMGTSALHANTTGYHNTAMGFQTLYSNTAGQNNTAHGYGALTFNTTGNNNTATGYVALSKNTAGNGNTANGYEALYNNTTGSSNTATGYISLYKNGTGMYNSGYGYGALYANVTGNSNTASGYAALYNLSAGSLNVAYGFQAGRYLASGSSYNTRGSSSVFLGSYTKAQDSTDSNEIVIGYNAIGAGSNSVVLGNTSITKTVLRGNVGIGTSNPQSALAVNGTVTAQKVKVTLTGWPDYVFDSTYQLPGLDRMMAYVSAKGHLPGMPSAREIASQGLDMGAMLRIQTEKIEQLLLYIVHQQKQMQELADRVHELENPHPLCVQPTTQP